MSGAMSDVLLMVYVPTFVAFWSPRSLKFSFMSGERTAFILRRKLFEHKRHSPTLLLAR